MKKTTAQTAIFCIAQMTFLLLPQFSSAQRIACGGSHSIYACTDSTANDWGWNLFGQLGNGIGNSNVPVAVLSLNDISDVSAGVNHSVALKTDNTVWTWGSNITGELGNGLTDGSSIPVQVTGLSDITAISSNAHNMALHNDGTVSTWGLNTYGELGNGVTGGSSNVPVTVSNLTEVTKVACGYYHSLALRSDSTVWGWGYSGGGCLGTGATMNEINAPIQINGLSEIVSIAGGNGFTLALKNDGTVWSLGSNNEGELGNGANANTPVPVQVSGLTDVIAITAGVYHSLAIKSDGSVWAWGFNLYGQLGNLANADSNVPVQVSGLANIVEIAVGYAHSLALASDGTLWAWGYNSYGQLGIGSYDNLNYPVQIEELCPVIIALEENSEDLKLSVYPNPFENSLTMNGTSENDLAILFNATGKEMVRQKTNDHTTKLFLQDLIPGIYFIRIDHDDQSTFFKISKL